MSISFPPSPTPGQIYQNWVWSGATWDAVNPGLTLQLRKQIFYNSGTYTPSPGMFQADVELVAGGGGGGGSTASTGNVTCGPGGGSGSYSRRLLTAAQIGASQAVTIGAAGLGVSGAAGTAGGATSFGTLVTANGGLGGALQPVAGGGNPGAGGAAGTGDIAIPGQAGGIGVFGSAVVISGPGAGGSGPFGVGGSSFNPPASVSTAGNSGRGYGSGGSGSSSYTTGAATGGNGAPGIAIVTEYCWITQAAVAAQAASGARVLIMAQTVSTPVASVDFTTGIDATYDEYVLEHINVTWDQTTSPFLRVFTAGAWDVAANYQYAYQQVYANATSAPFGGLTTYWPLADVIVGTAGLNNFTGTIRLFRPWLTTFRQQAIFDNVGFNTSPIWRRAFGGLDYAAATITAITGLRIAGNVGNINGGIFKLYGIVK